MIGRHSSFTYKGKKIDIKKLVQEWGVQYALEGSIQTTKANIRIIARLTDIRTEYQVWSEVFNKNPDDIFTLQDEIAFSITKAMQIELTDGEMVRSRFDWVSDFRVNLKLLKALDYLYGVNIEDNSLARKELHEIIDLNPNLPVAYGYLAVTYYLDLWLGACQSNIICFGKLTDALKKLIQLDDTSSDTQLIKGIYFIMKKDLESASVSFKQAIALNPNNAEAYSFLGYTYSALGLPNQAIEFGEKATKLDPVPVSEFYNHLGHAYRLANDFDKAIETYHKCINTQPNSKFPYINLAYIFTKLGKEKQAENSVTKVLEIDPNFSLKKFINVVPYSDDSVRVEDFYNTLHKAGFPD